MRIFCFATVVFLLVGSSVNARALRVECSVSDYPDLTFSITLKSIDEALMELKYSGRSVGTFTLQAESDPNFGFWFESEARGEAGRVPAFEIWGIGRSTGPWLNLNRELRVPASDPIPPFVSAAIKCDGSLLKFFAGVSSPSCAAQLNPAALQSRR